ncbi:hypothetical protein HY636_04395 [Candidatus Woesearchaeota archaeon]|nr:hypothetical protein [Candidatus Woesearchaeota archaeon]
MNLVERVNKSISSSKLEKAERVKEFFKRHYPEIIAPVYFGLETLLMHKLDSFSSVTETINPTMIDAGIGSVFLYASLYAHQHRAEERVKVVPKGVWKILNHPFAAGFALWFLVHNEMIRFDMYLLKGLFHDHRIEPRYGEYVILEPSWLMPPLENERMGFINFIKGYVSRSFAYLAISSAPFLGVTQAVFESLKPLCNPEQRKVTWLGLRLVYNLFRRGYKRYLEISEEMEHLSLEDYAANLSKAYAYSMMSDDNNALFELRKAHEKLPYKKNVRFMRFNLFIERLNMYLTEFLETLQLKKRLKKARNEGKLNKDILVLYCNRAYSYKVRGEHTKCLKTFEEALEVFPDSLELKVLYAEELEAGNDDEKKKAVEIHKAIYQKIESDEKYVLESCGETTKQVRQISGEASKFLNATYIYKQDSRGETEKANANLCQAREMYSRTLDDLMYDSKDEEKYDSEGKKRYETKRSIKKRIETLQTLGFSEDLLVIDCDNKIVQVMRRSVGQTLLEKINNCSEPETEEITKEILTVLAFIHAKMPIQGKKTRNSKEYFEDRVGKLRQEYNVESKIVDKLRLGYISDERLTPNYVFNKDAHPENWIIETGLIPELRQERIIAIDWDEKGTIEQAQELVNLLNYSGKMSWVFRINAAKHYFKEYSYFRALKIQKIQNTEASNTLSNKLDRGIIYEKPHEQWKEPDEQEQKLFALKYLNSVYERAVALCFAWSSPSRPRVQPLRAQILTNALESISVVKKEYTDFYIDHCTEFVRRDTGLRMLKDYFEHN